MDDAKPDALKICAGVVEALQRVAHEAGCRFGPASIVFDSREDLARLEAALRTSPEWRPIPRAVWPAPAPGDPMIIGGVRFCYRND